MQLKSQNTPEEEREVELCLNQFKIGVQQVALSAEKQIERFKGFDASYCVASDFGHWCMWALNPAQPLQLTAQQTAALRALDEYLDDMSGPENAKYWSDGALAKNPRWQRARELAMEVMRQFDWTLEGIPALVVIEPPSS